MSTTAEYLLSLGQQKPKEPDWQQQSAAQVQQTADAVKPQPQEYKVPGTEATQTQQTQQTPQAAQAAAPVTAPQTIPQTSVPSYQTLKADVDHEAKRNEDLAALAAKREADKKPTTYVDMIRKLYPELSDDIRWQTDEERIARRRKRDAIINSVGDGISALANIGTTSRYAAPLNLSSLSEASQARYDQIKAGRDAKKEAYRAAYLRAAQADAAADQAAKNKTAALAEAARKEAKEDNKWQTELLYKMGRAQAEDKYRNDKLKQDGELGRQRIQASVSNTRYRVNHKSSGSGRGGSNKYYGSIYDPSKGRDVAFATKADFERGWYSIYPDEPLPEEETRSTHVDEKGNVTTSSTKKRVITPEARAAAERKAKEKGSKTKAGGW